MQERPHRFAIYNVMATLAAAAGALASPLPERIAKAHDWDVATVMRLSFLIYVVTAASAAFVYRGLRTHAHLARRGAGCTSRARSSSGSRRCSRSTRRAAGSR